MDLLGFLRVPILGVRRLIWDLRFGNLRETVTGWAGDHIPAEIEYRDKDNVLVGFWAYGSWDPYHPYRGQRRP